MKSNNNYLDILEGLFVGGLLRPGAHFVDVYHDDTCSIWAGKPCDCTPDVKVRPMVKPINKELV
jgi:hypothetical protein